MPTTPDALFQSRLGKHDGFLTVVDPSKSGYPSVVSSTYFGTSRDEWIQGVDLHEFGGNVKAHVTGHTGAREGFPVTPEAYQEDPIKSSEVFFSVLAWQGQGNSPPTVIISSPGDSSTFDSGATIDFTGTASDVEDGNLTSSLVWTSTIDGQIGTGGSFLAVLSDGAHTITASVTDSGGEPGDDSITITVGENQNTVGVKSIDYSYKSKGKTPKLTITFTVEDDGNNPVKGANVTFHLPGPDPDSDYFTTGFSGKNGEVKYTIGDPLLGSYTLTVTDMDADGYTWDSNMVSIEIHIQ
jgi:hypothetical protein